MRFPQHRARRLSSAPATIEGSAINPRWLSDTKTRLGKCLTFGMSPDLVDQAGNILKGIAKDWHNLVAGSEGFLTSKERAGLDRQAVVWGEQDIMGHVNNVQYVRFAESGRCNWTRNYGTYFDVQNRRLWEEVLTSKNVGLILKSITVDYKFPMTWPDRISVYHKIRDKPSESTMSLILDVMILSEMKQRPAARCLEDVAIYNYKLGRTSTLPSFMLDQFTETFELQEQTKKENLAKVKTISDHVALLEKQTWDRPDAQEHGG